MKSAVLKQGKVEIIEKNKPELSAKGAILKVLGCGLCGSDIVKIKHSTPLNELSVVLGHEVVGQIIEINTNIVGNSYNNTNTKPFCEGDIVVLGHHYPCMECDFCANKSYSMCDIFKSTNIKPCGFSEYIFISEGHLKNTVFRIDSSLSYEENSFLEPLACCIRAIRRAGYSFEETNVVNNALVLGLGSIGLLMAQAIKAFGVNTYGFDINPERTEFAAKYGVEFDENIKYDCIFMTSGSSKAINSALKMVKNGGKIIVFSSIENEEGYKNNEIYYRELSVIASYSPAPYDLALSSYMLSERLVNVSGLSSEYSLDNLAQAVNDTILNKVFKAYIKV